MHQLTENFLLELFKLCFLKTSVIEIVKQHFQYQYIPNELKALKKILKSVLSCYDNTGKLPTYGYVSQQHSDDPDVQIFLSKIKQSDISTIESIISQLEEYIKLVRFQLLYEKVKEKYNSGDTEDAIILNAKESEEIVKFSITKNTSYFTKVFGDFNEILQDKQVRRDSGEFIKDKVPFGIDPIDEATFGGIDKGDLVCFLARSGIGKSTVLKWIGVHACRLGYEVLHIQLEGSQEEAYDKYTQVWTALKYINVKYGDIDPEVEEKINRVITKMKILDKDIYIKAFEMFDEATCVDVRELILKYEKDRGKLPDLVIIDSIDLLYPGDGIKYGADTQSIKMRKENSAKKLKNICVEFRTVRIITADQADNVPRENYNNPGWVMTRNNVSGAKNLPNSFSYFFTLNQTDDEKQLNQMRIHYDKLRNYNPENSTITIATNYDHGRFFDRRRTLELQMNPTTSGIKAKSVRSSDVEQD